MAGTTRDAGLILGSGISPGGGNGNPFQYFCLENSMEREKCWAIVQGNLRAGHNWSEREMLQMAFLYFNFKDYFSPAPMCAGGEWQKCEWGETNEKGGKTKVNVSPKKKPAA